MYLSVIFFQQNDLLKVVECCHLDLLDHNALLNCLKIRFKETMQAVMKPSHDQPSAYLFSNIISKKKYRKSKTTVVNDSTALIKQFTADFYKFYSELTSVIRPQLIRIKIVRIV